MSHRLEITLKPEFFDAEGEGVRKKAADYFGIELQSVRTINIITIDADFSRDQLAILQKEVFTNPVNQLSSFEPLPIPFDRIIWVGYRPGVRDNPGSTAVEAVEDALGVRFSSEQSIYTSKRYCLLGKKLSDEDANRIAGELLANDIIQQWRIYGNKDWDPSEGVGIIRPRVVLNHTPRLAIIPIESDEVLQKISDQRQLALNSKDIPIIRAYFMDERVRAQRAEVGLTEPTDLELEYISQARSDHCNHNTFRGRFNYQDCSTGKTEVVDNPFKTCIEAPTLELMKKKPWVKSVLWDNAGVGEFDENHYYVITGETHNSPSNMEAYGGAITGIVGVYRDPLGTGKGAKLIMGSYGYCVGPRDYRGPLKPRLHPRRLLDGIVEGVRDGGNKSGIPTPFGQVLFHPGYMGKCLVFVTAVGLMPAMVDGKPAEHKKTSNGDLAVMCGGRIGKDGIHGVTAASETFSENTPAGHVQIGDPYTQKKMHDFLLEARDEGLIQFITDNGGGGLSSSLGESARFSNGCRIDLEKAPLKYEGLDQWEIWVSESQERMTVAVKKENIDRFMELSAKHAVESTVLGEYTDSGKLHVTYNGETCAYVDMDLLQSGFPQWEFDAKWRAPEDRGLYEPVIREPADIGDLLIDLLARPNICSKEWITRQYDHEVQATSVIKPLIGVERDVHSDAAVIRPVLDSEKGLAFAQSLLPQYSAIDAFHMTACTIDEAVRRVIAVGGNPSHIGGVDNFCWPDIGYDSRKNPDGRFKAAQLVRACQALRNVCLAYEIPLLSGKDSMYVDGHLAGPYGETHKISAIETLQFSTISEVVDVKKCITLDLKAAGDLVYVLGNTKDELGGSEYYEHFGYVGLHVPRVDPAKFAVLYRTLSSAIEKELIASAHGVYRGGLGVHLAMISIAGRLGMDIDLDRIPQDGVRRTDTLLFSETPGRFVITAAPEHETLINKLFRGIPHACIGKVTEKENFVIRKGQNEPILKLDVSEMKSAWKEPFRDL